MGSDDVLALVASALVALRDHVRPALLDVYGDAWPPGAGYPPARAAGGVEGAGAGIEQQPGDPEKLRDPWSSYEQIEVGLEAVRPTARERAAWDLPTATTVSRLLRSASAGAMELEEKLRKRHVREPQAALAESREALTRVSASTTQARVDVVLGFVSPLLKPSGPPDVCIDVSNLIRSVKQDELIERLMTLFGSWHEHSGGPFRAAAFIDANQRMTCPKRVDRACFEALAELPDADSRPLFRVHPKVDEPMTELAAESGIPILAAKEQYREYRRRATYDVYSPDADWLTFRHRSLEPIPSYEASKAVGHALKKRAEDFGELLGFHYRCTNPGCKYSRFERIPTLPHVTYGGKPRCPRCTKDLVTLEKRTSSPLDRVLLMRLIPNAGEARLPLAEGDELIIGRDYPLPLKELLGPDQARYIGRRHARVANEGGSVTVAPVQDHDVAQRERRTSARPRPVAAEGVRLTSKNAAILANRVFLRLSGNSAVVAPDFADDEATARD